VAITVRANPAQIKWDHFVETADLVDPNDGSPVDAVTRFNYDLPSRQPRRVDGRVALADPLVLTITPLCRVRPGTRKTAALLSHEQLHYDVGIVTARALARKLMQIRARNLAELRQELIAAFDLHFQRRAGLLQTRYDRDTRHGLNAQQQRVWKNQMARVLANPNSSRLHGYWL